ncbi:MAG: hypothetical protein HYY35_03095 [Deltaproteobacteria bacterium]|nr:hypothetical protein [Deltaproteobacteria bacterium]
MSNPKEPRLRRSHDALERLGIAAEGATVETLTRALEADAETTLAVAERLGGLASEDGARLLARLAAAAGEDKLLRREVRRSLYRLKQRGVEIAEPAAETAPAPARAAPGAEGFLSFGDPAGDRLLWVLKPRAGGGLLHFSTVVNEPAGLKEAVLAEVNRKSVRALRELEKRHGLRLVEVDARYCDWIAAEGYERARARGDVSASAARYPQLRLQLFAAPAAPAALPEPSVAVDAAASLSSSAALFEEEELRHWVVPEAALAAHLERYREIRNSPLVLDRASQMTRIEEIVAGAVEGVFAAERAASWQRRLEETAYLFAHTARPEAAQRAAAVAAAIAERRSGRGIPFCEELVRRSFGLFFAQEAEREREERASSVLVTPDDLRAAQARARSAGPPRRGP